MLQMFLQENILLMYHTMQNLCGTQVKRVFRISFGSVTEVLHKTVHTMFTFFTNQYFHAVVNVI